MVATNKTQTSDTHIVTVAGHGVDPSPVPEGTDGSARHMDKSDPDSAEFLEPDHGVYPKHHKVTLLRKKSAHAKLREFFVWYCIPIILVLLVRIFLVGVYAIPSGSMLDTIHIGDQVLTTKLTPGVFPLKRGDIIVFEDPANWLSGERASGAVVGKDLIKRLIGLPGDTVTCEGEGQPVKVNGVPIDEKAYIRPGVEPSAFPFKVKVSEGHVFVLGDNRANSADSRYHRDDGEDGLVPISKVKGVALLRYWPLNRFGVIENQHDVFAHVDAGKRSE